MLSFDMSGRSAISILSKIFVFGAVLLLAGCVKPRKFPKYLTVADVVNNIKCQLYNAVLDETQSVTYENGTSSFVASRHWLTDWTATFSLILQVVRKGELSGDTSYVTPYTLGTFTNKVSAGLSKQATSKLTLDFDAESDLVNFMSKERCAYNQEHRRRRNLAGETGLSLWFGKLIEGIDNANISATTTKFVYSIEFALSVDGNFIPSYSFTYPSLRKIFGMAKLSKSRTDSNSLTVSFVSAKPEVVTPGPFETQLGVLKEIYSLLKDQGIANKLNLQALIEFSSKGNSTNDANLKALIKLASDIAQMRKDKDEKQEKGKLKVPGPESTQDQRPFAKPAVPIQGNLDENKLKGVETDPKPKLDVLEELQLKIDNAIKKAKSQQAVQQKKGRTGMSERTRAIHDSLRLREAIGRIR